jgi:hypothetical protein
MMCRRQIFECCDRLSVPKNFTQFKLFAIANLIGNLQKAANLFVSKTPIYHLRSETSVKFEFFLGSLCLFDNTALRSALLRRKIFEFF